MKGLQLARLWPYRLFIGIEYTQDIIHVCVMAKPWACRQVKVCRSRSFFRGADAEDFRRFLNGIIKNAPKFTCRTLRIVLIAEYAEPRVDRIIDNDLSNDDVEKLMAHYQQQDSNETRYWSWRKWSLPSEKKARLQILSCRSSVVDQPLAELGVLQCACHDVELQRDAFTRYLQYLVNHANAKLGVYCCILVALNEQIHMYLVIRRQCQWWCQFDYNQADFGSGLWLEQFDQLLGRQLNHLFSEYEFKPQAIAIVTQKHQAIVRSSLKVGHHQFQICQLHHAFAASESEQYCTSMGAALKHHEGLK